MNRKAVATVVCILIFFAILIHQLIFYEKLIELKDVLHHEFFAFVFLAFGLGLALGEALE